MQEASLIAVIRANLEREMEAKGLKGKRLARTAGLNDQAVRDLMKNVENPRIETLYKLADALGIPATNLFAHLVPIVGDVGAEAIVTFRGGDAELEEAPAPPTSFQTLQAICVKGHQLLPAHRDGDLLYISREHQLVDASFFDNECVIRLHDGSAFLGTLEEGSRSGVVCLNRIGAHRLKDIEPIWCAPVLFTMRGWLRANTGQVPARPAAAQQAH